MKKLPMVGLALLLALPVTGFAASQIVKYDVDSAVEEVQKHDLSTEVKASDTPKLSRETQAYQGEFTDQLENIQEMQSENQDRNASLQSELTAYNLVFGYWMAHENDQLQQNNLGLAEEEYSILSKKFDKGIISELELLNGKVSVNNAKVQFEDAKQALTSAKNQLNQRLGHEDLNGELAIDADFATESFDLLDSSETNAEKILPDVLPKHLGFLDDIIAEYGDILDSIDGLTVLGGDAMQDGISELNDTLSLISQLKSADPEQLSEDQRALLGNEGQMREQLNDLEADYQQALRDLEVAKEELKDYYIFQRSQVVNQQEQLKEQVELLAYQYENRFKNLEEKIKLYEENEAMYDELYKKNKKILENGLMIENELEQVRMGLNSSIMQLNSAKKDYQLLMKEYELFQKGLLAVQGY